MVMHLYHIIFKLIWTVYISPAYTICCRQGRFISIVFTGLNAYMKKKLLMIISFFSLFLLMQKRHLVSRLGPDLNEAYSLLSNF